MKPNTTQHAGTIGKNTRSTRNPQLLNELRRRAFDAKDGLLSLSAGGYMAFVDAQASREGSRLTDAKRKLIRQILNGRLKPAHVKEIELIERALQFQQAA